MENGENSFAFMGLAWFLWDWKLNERPISFQISNLFMDPSVLKSIFRPDANVAGRVRVNKILLSAIVHTN